MIRRMQYRCSFKSYVTGREHMAESCREEFVSLIKAGKVINASFYRYESMGFLYVEENVEDENAPALDIDNIMSELIPCLRPWPEESGDCFFVPMINVYYHHVPGDDIDSWEHERITDDKQRIGRVAFVFPDKLPSYVMHHNAIVQEGLLKGDKYAFISMHENLLFSYYEEPRNNVNIKDSDEESRVINDWLLADPESHFDRVKAKGSNFLVIPCIFTVDKVDQAK
jgi:hypothetical protein